MPEKLYRVLFLSSNPNNRQHLRVDDEYKEIRKETETNDDFDIEQEPSVNLEDFRRRLVHYKPQIVHFSGHGDIRTLSFQDNEGQAEDVRAEQLAEVFKILNSRPEVNNEDKIKLVVLNACYSDLMANTISRHVDYVIGMQKAITDDAAIGFAAEFYFNIRSGESIKTAFRMARNALGDKNFQAEEIPKITPDDDKASSMFFKKATEPIIDVKQFPPRHGSLELVSGGFVEVILKPAKIQTAEETKYIVKILNKMSEEFGSIKIAFRHTKNAIDARQEGLAVALGISVASSLDHFRTLFDDCFTHLIEDIPNDAWKVTQLEDFKNCCTALKTGINNLKNAADDGVVPNYTSIKNNLSFIERDFEQFLDQIIQEIHSQLGGK